jgi:hypothetical protein
MHLEIQFKQQKLIKRFCLNLHWLSLQIVSREKRGWLTLGSYLKLSEQNLAKTIGYLNSSRKNTQFKKNNRLKRGLRNKVMSILNSTIFHFFFFFRKKLRNLHDKIFINPCSIFGVLFI